MSTDPKSQYLSRSALAEKLGVTLKELTQLMIESGWLAHSEAAEKGKEWTLTAKGEFEGGIYRDSKKFGKYIVWPDTVVNHPAISGIKDTQISATAIAKQANVSAKIINRLFAEMGWISPYAKGWKVTTLGQANGGVQAANNDTGVPYAMWARTVLAHEGLLQQLKYYKAEQLIEATINHQTHFLSLDGRYIASKPELLIANWLYVSGFSYAYQRMIHVSQQQSLLSDFYLPKYAIHIHFQAVDIAPSELSQQLQRQALSDKHHLQVIQLSVTDTQNIDQVLSKALLQMGANEE
jgi:predicted transcriptional regulator